jgi:hypothetical protein
VVNYNDYPELIKPLKKRCRILPAGGLRGVPSFRKLPNLGGIGGCLRLFQQSLAYSLCYGRQALTSVAIIDGGFSAIRFMYIL